MNNAAASVFFVSHLAAVTGRPVSDALADASLDFFTGGAPDPDDDTMLNAIDKIAGSVEGEGAITQAQLYKAVAAYHAQYGTPYCPPILAALDEAGD